MKPDPKPLSCDRKVDAPEKHWNSPLPGIAKSIADRFWLTEGCDIANVLIENASMGYRGTDHLPKKRQIAGFASVGRRLRTALPSSRRDQLSLMSAISEIRRSPYGRNWGAKRSLHVVSAMSAFSRDRRYKRCKSITRIATAIPKPASKRKVHACYSFWPPQRPPREDAAGHSA